MEAMSIRLSHILLGSNQSRTRNDLPDGSTIVYIRSVFARKHQLVVRSARHPSLGARGDGQQQTLRTRDGARASKPCQWIRLNMRTFVGAGLALVVGVAACGLSVLGDPATPAANPAGWQMSFDDEFDGPAGAPPDPSRWLPDFGGTGWGNKELQFYTRSGNVFLDGQGHLVIEARRASEDLNCWYGRCEYSSGKVTTHATFQSADRASGVAFSQAYGRFEARIKAPGEHGLLPAFWLLGDNIDYVGHPKEGEIDVVETVGDQVNVVQQHAHGPGFDFGHAFRLPGGQTITDWHTYAIEWSPDRITWTVDGLTTGTLLREAAGGGWVFDHPFFILLDLAVGGNWPGSPDDQTHFPAQMLVDYVRVFVPGN